METALVNRDRPLAVLDIVAADIRPRVRAIDADGWYPEPALRRLGDSGAFAHHIDGIAQHGGLIAAIDAMAAVGSTCLSTAFCIWCQDALAWYLDQSANSEIRHRLLLPIARGSVLGGTGLSNPMKAFSGIEPLSLRGQQVDGGYRVTGRLPWVSNLGPDHLFASIFSLEDGRRVMAVFDCSDSAITLAQNAHFIALEGTRTFAVQVREAFIRQSDVLAENAVEFVPRIRQGFVLLQLGMALGVARGAAEAMRQDGSGRQAGAWLPLSPDRIDERAQEIRSRAQVLSRSADDPSRAAFLEVLRVRLDASWLALQAAEMAALQAGARGYLQGSETDRRRREAQFVAIVTPSVKHITKELAAGG